MNEQLKLSDTIPIPPQSEPVNTAAVLKDIQQRLVFLERKIDALLNQSLQKPAFRERNFSKSQRPFGHFNKHRKGQHDNNSREENFPQSQPRHFDKPRRDGNQGFGGKKKRFFHRGKA